MTHPGQRAVCGVLRALARRGGGLEDLARALRCGACEERDHCVGGAIARKTADGSPPTTDGRGEPPIDETPEGRG